VRIEGREVEIKFILWDKATWTLAHATRYGDFSVTVARPGLQAYAPEHNCFFAQFDDPPADCFWFGDIKSLLEQTHGEIPMVLPARSNTKRD
jgi:hypothetical protein